MRDLCFRLYVSSFLSFARTHPYGQTIGSDPIFSSTFSVVPYNSGLDSKIVVPVTRDLVRGSQGPTLSLSRGLEVAPWKGDVTRTGGGLGVRDVSVPLTKTVVFFIFIHVISLWKINCVFWCFDKV